MRRRCEGGLSIRRGEACLALFDRTAVVDAGRGQRRPHGEERTFARGGFVTRAQGDALRRRCEGGLSIRRGEACLALFDRTAVVDAGRRMRRPLATAAHVETGRGN